MIILLDETDEYLNPQTMDLYFIKKWPFIDHLLLLPSTTFHRDYLSSLPINFRYWANDIVHLLIRKSTLYFVCNHQTNTLCYFLYTARRTIASKPLLNKNSLMIRSFLLLLGTFNFNMVFDCPFNQFYILLL